MALNTMEEPRAGKHAGVAGGNTDDGDDVGHGNGTAAGCQAGQGRIGGMKSQQADPQDFEGIHLLCAYGNSCGCRCTGDHDELHIDVPCR